MYQVLTHLIVQKKHSTTNTINLIITLHSVITYISLLSIRCTKRRQGNEQPGDIWQETEIKFFFSSTIQKKEKETIEIYQDSGIAHRHDCEIQVFHAHSNAYAGEFPGLKRTRLTQKLIRWCGSRCK